jgi:DNA (cytosine-5)-methyltransferase 1
MTAQHSKIKFIDLFAGIGGFRIALESFGMKCVFSSEWDKYAQISYKENFGELPQGDITKINEEDIPEHNILAAGFPCQAFSISGKQRGFEDTRGTLFFHIARILKKRKPEIAILENVKNFARHDNGKTISVVLGTLKEIGYKPYNKILNASAFGLPQKRERIFIVAFRSDLGINEFKFTTSLNKPSKLIDFLDRSTIKRAYIINRRDMTVKNIMIKKDIFGNYSQKPIRIGTINNGGQGERIYSPLGHAITLSAYGGGVAAKTGAYKINGNIRKLTPRECANIMGFPPSFIITVQDVQAYKQFGNSVAIPVVKSVIADILNALPINI